MAEDAVLFPSLSPALAVGPIEPGVTMILLTDKEREFLLATISDADAGVPAAIRQKLRAAAPVRDVGFHGATWSGAIGKLIRLFEIDGRERGTCRWCGVRARVDEFGFCTKCHGH